MMVIVFDANGFYMALAEGIDPFEHALAIGGTAVTMIGDPPGPLYEPMIDGTWHIPPEVLYNNAAVVENQWREEEMERVANQLLMLEDDDPNALPGTARQWKDYRIKLRNWTTANTEFPDLTKRPVAPS